MVSAVSTLSMWRASASASVSLASTGMFTAVAELTAEVSAAAVGAWFPVVGAAVLVNPPNVVVGELWRPSWVPSRTETVRRSPGEPIRAARQLARKGVDVPAAAGLERKL